MNIVLVAYEIQKFIQRILLTGRRKEPQAHRIPWQNFAIIPILLFSGCQDGAISAYGQRTISDTEAIRIIVGEASNQSYEGMIAVGEVIRNNGDIRAFKGLNAEHSAHESFHTWMKASRAWQASANSKITHGANHFDNVEEFGEPYWAPDCRTTVIIGQQYFFKC